MSYNHNTMWVIKHVDKDVYYRKDKHTLKFSIIQNLHNATVFNDVHEAIDILALKLPRSWLVTDSIYSPDDFKIQKVIIRAVNSNTLIE